MTNHPPAASPEVSGTASGTAGGTAAGRRALERGLRESAKTVIRTCGTTTAPLRHPPDFLIVGAKRGGTTSLWNWLLQHPGCLPMIPARQGLKSNHYFYWHFDRGPRWYRGFFASDVARRLASRRAGGPVATGEASPYYLFDPRVPERVAAELPAVKIIILLRDPVDRAASHHRERTRAGVEPLGFADALAAEEGRLAGELERMAADPFYYSRPHDWYSYRSRGIYAPQVAAWQAVVPTERMLVVQSEELYTDPRGTFDTVTDFLGLGRIEELKARRYNYHRHEDMPAPVRAELTEFYRDHNRRLFEVLGRELTWPEAA
jgi:hypothetical protein